MTQSNSRNMQDGAICLASFLHAVFSSDQELLGGMILEKSIGLIAGPRGSGKSLFSMIIAYAVAAKKSVLPWGTGGGLPVVILDGEMRAAGFQERLRLLHAYNSDPESRAQAEANLHVISRDYFGDPIGSIDTDEGQNQIDNLIPDSVKLIVVDNISSWSNGGREDSNSWAIIKKWLIKKRLRGVAVLLIHHTGKNGQQRGSSTHEDLLDYSILLTTLERNLKRQDTRFGIEHTKLRDYLPDLQQKYECSIWTENGSLRFEVVPAGFQASEHEIQIMRMRDEGKPMEEIGKELKISKSTVSRILKKLVSKSTANNGMDS